MSAEFFLGLVGIFIAGIAAGVFVALTERNRLFDVEPGWRGLVRIALKGALGGTVLTAGFLGVFLAAVAVFDPGVRQAVVAAALRFGLLAAIILGLVILWIIWRKKQ